jgi:hypothetical protein
VVDLVKLVQSCLYLFGMLGPDILDGLLCDVTEKSIIEWWNQYGTAFYDAEPTDGILGPTTVAGLLGMTLGVRYRLVTLRIDTPKDMMEIKLFQDAISQFQKGMKLDRTKILDRPTLDKLYMLTARSGAGEHRLPGTKTLRTIGHDLSNRQIVNAADIETCDIEAFMLHLHGDRLRYMWQGKGRRPSTGSTGGLTPSQSFADLKDASVSKRHKVFRGVKTGAKGVGKIVRRAPETVIERVQSQRGGGKRDREVSDEIFFNPVDVGEALTPVTTRESEYQKDLKATPPPKPRIGKVTYGLSDLVPKIQSEEVYPDTPETSASEPMSLHEDRANSPPSAPPPASIERPKSACDEQIKEHHDAWYPRRLSFSIAQDVIETWKYPFEIETDRLEMAIDSVHKWAEDQLDAVEESIDQVETNLPTISSNYAASMSAFSNMQSTAKQVLQRIGGFTDKTRGIHDTTMKLRYAYSSADGLVEKLQSVTSVMDGIQARMERLNSRIDAVEKKRLRYKLERRYRIRWLIMTGVTMFIGLAWLARHLRR